MRIKLSPVLALCILVTSASVILAQSGPDNDPDGAPGYVNSAFHHGQVDSINMYNGQLTIPIALGPSYPVGPHLRMQVVIAYNSRSTDYGAPAALEQSNFFSFKPLVGNPSLGSGWELTLGAIKACKHGTIVGNCYFSADGSQHMFGGGPRASDATQLSLSGTGPFDMWDGDGNHYVFAWHVTGYDDIGLPEGYTHDFGRGRDGWYLTSVTDPFGNGYAISYYDRSTIATPSWTYGASTCPAHTTTIMQMRNPSATNTWIPKDVTLPSGGKVHFNTGSVRGVSGVITSVDFPVLVDGSPATKTWTLAYEGAFVSLNHGCGTGGTVPVNVPRLKSLALPADDSGASPSYQFSSLAELGEVLLDQVTLPTGATIQYCYNTYTFFHGRGGRLEPGCPGMTPPRDDPDNVVWRSSACPVSITEDLEPEIPGQCTPTNPNRWIDTQTGVVRRREIIGGAQNDTTYTQYAYPFGESGDSTNPHDSQTLTIAVFPGTDKNGDAGRSRATAILFSSTRGPAGGGMERGSVPGDIVGAELEERTFETDPTTGALQHPPCGGGSDSAFCGSKAVRVVQKDYDLDTDGLPGSNRRLQQETTVYGASMCGGCPSHSVAFTLTGADTWEGNGRHYNVETHTGTLGGDNRTITTDWAPVNWTTPPSASQPALPNLWNQRTSSQGSSTRDEYFEFETSPPTGFLKGTFVYDALRDIAFITCRYNDGSGSLDKELTRTLSTASAPPRTYCSATYPTFPSSVGTDGDLFGKDYAWQHGELLSARWVNGAVGTATFRFRDQTRDATTGWITASKDAAGLQTSYTYDALGRVRRITPPPAAELSTFVCYEGPNATTAYRAPARQACPVAASNANAATWQHYEYDGLARLVREKRLQPGSAVVKRFTLFDGPGNAYFASEWVADGTSESVTRDLATTCAFSGGALTGRARPSGAPGTYRLCYDPFGRPQQVVGPKMSSLATIDRTDGGGNIYSDTQETVVTFCVNATFSNLSTPTCQAGGINATTTTRKDAYGRVTSVTEPSGDVTSHTYDVNGKLLTVTQGAQLRTFTYDTNGFLRSEKTPERGLVTYDTIGSLGNVRAETQPGNLLVSRAFDFAGRLVEEDVPAGTKYVVNCYDGAATCVDGSAGSAGGDHPAGKLTRRYGYNWIPTVGPAVDEQFTYSDGAGRLSQSKTIVGSGDLGGPSQAATQSWTYNTLGLLQQHNNPRVSGSFPIVYSYSNALPTAISGGLSTLVSSATYNPAAGLASWTAGNAGTPVVTTISQDSTMLPRPARIKASGASTLFDTGTFAYDGAGNILSESDPTSGGTFTYDNRSRILSATYGAGAGSKAFAYDRFGNLLQNGSLTFQVDTAANNNHLKIGGSASAVGYDARGNMTTYNGDTMSYDSLDRLYRNQSGSTDFVFLHNGAGERLVKFPGNTSLLRREMARLVGEANKMAGKNGWSTTPNPCVPNTFSDVNCNTDVDGDWIQTLVSHGTATGCDGGRFCPDGTLNRAQMAALVVKGYRADGAPTPSCTGIFADVPCSGTSPWVSFAPFIEQLSRDGVTAGCGGSNFCPGNPVTPWQILVWMSKTPAVPGGVAWGAVYHPVPRGSIYTFRDEQNRVVTEMTNATSDSGWNTLAASRDNVFLANLLVASNTSLGWNFDVSDHLGSIRTAWSSTGVLTESHKYWPYGEDTNPSPSNQHLSFQAMERNDGVAQHFDHARTQNYALGRFLGPDKAGASPRAPQSWNRYAYTLGNPLKHIDPDGLLTILVHGTQFGGRTADFTPAGHFFNYVSRSIGDRTTASYNWSGGDTHAARVDAAKGLAEFIRSYKFAPGEGLNIIAHSHGGNVAIAAINMGLGHKVDNLVTLGTPSTSSYRLNGTAGVSNWVNVFNVFDKLQTHGGGADDSPLQSGAAARTQPLAYNLELDENLGALDSHTWLHSSEAWDGVFPYLKTIQAFGAPMFLWVTR